MLKTAHTLVKHWSDVNGCLNASSRLDRRMLYSITRVVLSNYEIAVRLMLSSASISLSPSCRRNTSDTTTRAGEDSLPKAVIGKLELDLVERAIVVQKAVKHSVLRLTAVLQDIEEEAALATRSNEVECPLPDRGLQELIARLFRLLGTESSMCL
ncbi:hypothetical protein F5B22DRAFT_228410 [Xylaria bambusicola]|uniref:uncharacterized protein n=1 Tax=Xylaria bambusicola TaxID=326684 RepID=UPI002008544C|nr:uncharacterized protein F5B22DRAFT_228410 [Xylaria bambusicola]KAI0514720.1 hypothetical protein F5B22DRAFT_228410 [Xylaria bambusicola]